MTLSPRPAWGLCKQGGNAVDGGVSAAAFVAQLAEPGMCGVGGNGIICVHRADRDETTVFDDTTVPPGGQQRRICSNFYPDRAASNGWENVRDDANIIGHKSVAIPGTVAGLCAVLERYGDDGDQRCPCPSHRTGGKRRGGGYTNHHHDSESDEALRSIPTSGETLSGRRFTASTGNLLGTGRQAEVSRTRRHLSCKLQRTGQMASTRAESLKRLPLR